LFQVQFTHNAALYHHLKQNGFQLDCQTHQAINIKVWKLS
jgi:hypothetical protein